MRLNISKIFTAVTAIFLLTSCATKHVGLDSFKEMPADKILAGGKEHMKKKDYEEAIKYFEAIDALYPFSSYAKQGQIDIIYAYYKDNDYESAIAAADRYIHLHPRGKRTDYVYYLKGKINLDRGKNWLRRKYKKNDAQCDLIYVKEASINFQNLITLFPKSIYVKEAREKIAYIHNLSAQSELDIANFYFERKMYVAAINRANDVVKNFAKTPQEIEALEILVQSYRELGEYKQAEAAKRRLQAL